MEILKKIQTISSYLTKEGFTDVDSAIVLGSGFGDFVKEIPVLHEVNYKNIPLFPQTTVTGHKGQLLLTSIGDRKVLVFCGRFHYYEGHDLETVTLPIRVASHLGVKTLILTNASGGIQKHFNPGTLMVIRDHINLMGTNPLCGQNLNVFGPRFPDMTEVYNIELRKMALRLLKKNNIPHFDGVYCSVSGPSYETPAEIHFLKKIGVDAVGMSTVPEAIVARHSGMKVLGLSCITNLASGISATPLSHEEVIQTGKKTVFGKFLLEVLKQTIYR